MGGDRCFFGTFRRVLCFAATSGNGQIPDQGDKGNCMFQTLDVEEIGPYNEEGDYWPVKVRMKGACDGGMRTVKVDQTEVFLFYEEGKEYWRFRQ